MHEISQLSLNLFKASLLEVSSVLGLALPQVPCRMQPLEPLLSSLPTDLRMLRSFRTQIQPEAFRLLCKDDVFFLEQHNLLCLPLQLYDKPLFLLESLLDLLLKREHLLPTSFKG
jgi:hypothetical protein